MGKAAREIRLGYKLSKLIFVLSNGRQLFLSWNGLAYYGYDCRKLIGKRVQEIIRRLTAGMIGIII